MANKFTGAVTAVWRQVTGGPRRWSPAVFFVYDLLILLLLLVIGPFHVISWGQGIFHNPFQTVLPSVVPWAGAVGGVCISLVGVTGHSVPAEWDPKRFGYWHLTRAILGAIFGTAAVLIVVLLLQNVKGLGASNTGYTLAGQLVLGVIAFVVGFREETFRTLVMRVVDMIIGPSAGAATNPVAFVPPVIEFATVAVGTTTTGITHLFNGSPNTLHVSAGAITNDNPTVAMVANATDVDVAPGGSIPVKLTWTPGTVGDLTATVTVKLSNQTPTCAVHGVAK